MGLAVTFVSGPRSSGKSTLIRRMIDHLFPIKPHYLRLVLAGSDKLPPEPSGKTIPECGVASARWLEYHADQIFEILPEALTIIHRRDRFGAVIIEADADPNLRHAYPYDHRIFIMPMPKAAKDVFRDPRRAAEELKRVLDDTAAFASEIYGLFDKPGQDEVDPSEPRVDLSDSQMRGFLYSPLGDELATRIQLRPPFHGMVESDVIIVNPGMGADGPDSADCVKRIQKLLKRIRGNSGRNGELFLCDPFDPDSRPCKKLFKAIKPMCKGGS